MDEISNEELWLEIEQKTLFHFGMDGRKFLTLNREGLIADSFARSEIMFLVRCLSPDFIDNLLLP